MNALLVLGYIAALLYGVFIDGSYFMIYIPLVLAYYVVTQFFILDKKDITKRKNMLITTWDGKTCS